jgi:hypothetical protein
MPALSRHIPILAAACLATVLSGCVHAVDMVPLDGGRPGIGDVRVRGGSMFVRVDGKRFSGPFIEASSPELAVLNGPGAGPIPTGRYWGVQGKEGHRGALLTARDGSTIACRFMHDGSVHVGSGLCRGDDGRNFALRMR